MKGVEHQRGGDAQRGQALGLLLVGYAFRDALDAGNARIACPTLVIAGSQDPATPAVLGQGIAASIPNAQYVELDAAHLSNIEQAEAFTGAVLRFLTAK